MDKIALFLIAITLLALTLTVDASASEIKKCTDADNKITYTNGPCPDDITQVVTMDIESKPARTASTTMASIGANDTIRMFCIDKWADDYNMRNYCVEKQTQALLSMKGLREWSKRDRTIVGQCANKWTENGLNNYAMIKYCVDKQVSAAANW